MGNFAGTCAQNGRVSLEELQRVLEVASKEYSHFEEHAKFLEKKNSRCARVYGFAVFAVPEPCNCLSMRCQMA